jgi:vancomycin resistance protein YoaR
VQAKSKAVKITLVVTGLAVCGVAATLTAYARAPEGIIAEGVRVAGMDWGGKSTVTARSELEGWRQARLQEPLTLTLPASTKNAQKWTVKRDVLGADVDIEATVSEAEQVARKDSALTRVLGLFSRREVTEIQPRWKIDPARARKFLAEKVAPKALRKEKDARFLATKEGFKVVPEQPGTALDVEAAIQAITAQLTEEGDNKAELPVKQVAPHVTTADLKGIEGEVSRFQTHYSERGNRARNIEVACSHINGTVLRPGDVFSYNKVVGPREAEGGFKMAPVIINGRLRPGMGGGVCQTSTTLYNAVLMAGLKIVRRSHHAFPVHYVPAGRDATVAYDSLDFQFQNNTDSVIAVASDGTGGRVLMRVFGKKVPGRSIAIERTNLSSWGAGTETVRDSDLAAGVTRTIEKGHSGHRATVWRITKMNGKVVSREQVSRDYYRAFPRIVAVGTRQVARKPSGTSAQTAPASGTIPASTETTTGPGE